MFFLQPESFSCRSNGYAPIPKVFKPSDSDVFISFVDDPLVYFIRNYQTVELFAKISNFLIFNTMIIKL